jgi:hypothetical protein
VLPGRLNKGGGGKREGHCWGKCTQPVWAYATTLAESESTVGVHSWDQGHVHMCLVCLHVVVVGCCDYTTGGDTAKLFAAG